MEGGFYLSVLLVRSFDLLTSVFLASSLLTSSHFLASYSELTGAHSLLKLTADPANIIIEMHLILYATAITNLVQKR